jgi:hypothetical protein
MFSTIWTPPLSSLFPPFRNPSLVTGLFARVYFLPIHVLKQALTNVETDRISVSVSFSAPKIAKVTYSVLLFFGRKSLTDFRFIFGFGRKL